MNKKLKNIVDKIRNTIIFVFRYYKIKPQKITRGDSNADKTFYITCVSYRTDGLFSIMKSQLTHIAYALDHHYIPVVNMKDFYSQYLGDNVGSTENVWEYFFEQPFNYHVEDTLTSKHIILSRRSLTPNSKYHIHTNILDDENKYKFLYYKTLFRTYIRFNNETKNYLDEDFKRVLGNHEKVLGILCRGTDYLMKKPHNHPVQPDPIVVLQKADEIIRQQNCDKIFLATEDKRIYNMFFKHFSDKLLTNNQVLYDADDLKDVTYLSEIKAPRDNNNYLKGIEYLSSMYLLSKCACFIGGRTAGTIGVYFMSDGFEYDYTWDLGNYK